MANIIVQGKEYSNVPAVRLPAVGGGSATFYESGGGGVIAQPITITVNGVYTAPEDTAYTPVTVNVPSGTPTLQSKTVNPTTSQQTVSPDTGYDGLSSVTVNAMPSGSATTPTTTITANPTISVSSSGLITATASASQSITPTVSSGYISTGTSGTVSVSGSNTQQLSTQSAVTITPTESQQTAVASGKYTTGAVLVGAISSSYVGSGITRRDSTDLSASGDTITVPSGYYADSASKAVSSGSATTPATTISPSVNISVSNSGLITATAQDYEDITPTVVAGYVSSGTSGRVDVDAYDTYQLPTQSATTITPSTVSQTAVTAGKYTTGAITVDPIPSQYIVPTGTVSITSNGTVDVTQYASANVNVSNWTLLGSKDFTINQTGESNTSIGSITIGASAWTKDNVIWVRTRDKAGARNGYYYGSDTMFFNANAENGVASTYSVRSVNTIRYNSSQFACYNGAYGVFAYSITTAGKVNIYARYNSTYSLTINGTFSVEVYSLSLPTGKTIF